MPLPLPSQPEVADLGRRAAAAASDAEPSSQAEALLIGEVELTACLTTARASLVAGADAGALEAALQVRVRFVL